MDDNDSVISTDDDDDDESLSPAVHICRRSKDFDELRRIRGYPKPIHTIQFQIHVDHGYTDEEQKQLLREVVQSLPKLRRIEIVSFARTLPFGSRLPIRNWSVSVLTDLLENVPSIESVRLVCLRMMGTYSQFQQLGNAIRKLTALERFCLDKVSVGRLPNAPVVSDLNQGCWLGPVVSGLASLEHLQHLRILGAYDFEHMGLAAVNGQEHTGPVLQNEVLQELCKSSSLRSLCLIHFNLNDDNVFHLAEQLQTNTSLKELDIDCTLGTASSLAIYQLLERNATLEDLNLCVRSAEETTSTMEEVTKAEEEVNIRLAQGVGRSGLLNFALFRGKVNPKSVDAFKSMIVHQSSLKSLTLYSGDDDINEAFASDPTISFYCKLNKFGRRRLLSDDPPGVANTLPFFPPELTLVDTLGRLSDDLSCLFYLLSAKPSICNRAIQKMEEEERTTKLNRKRKSSRRSPLQAPPIKRTRLYREAKYRNISYAD